MSTIGKAIDVLDDVAKLVGWAADLRAAAGRQLQAAGEIDALAAKLRAEGRRTLTEEEWTEIAAPALAARDKLADALKK